MRLPRLSLRSPRQRWFLIAVVALLLGVVVGIPVFAQDNLPANPIQGASNALGNAIFLILSFVVWAMTKLFAVLTSVFVQLLIIVARYNVFLNAPVVQSGWPIVRDLMNMMFIIALLIIAAGTVLRLQNYRYNRLLGKLIIMAILVNFSKFIAVFLLQFAQVVMLTFVNAFRDIAFANFSHSFGLDQVLAFTAGQNVFNNNGTFSIFLSLLAGLIMMIVAFVVMLSMTVMLFVRIIALWLLIILSPIAYALRILPNTERYAAQWWSEFTKYAVLGPVLAFFLWVSLALANGTACTNTTGCENPLRADKQVVAAISDSQSSSGELWYDFVTPLLGLDKMMSFIVAIIFLMLGMQYAQRSGAAGAAFAGKVAQAGFGAAATVTGLNAIRDRTIAPVQGWLKNRQAARQSAIQERTQALEAAGDRTKARFGVTQAQRERGAAAAAAYERQKVARQAQRQGYANLSRDELQDHMLNNRDQSKRMAALQELSSRGMLDLNDRAQSDAFEDITKNSRMPQADVRKLREQTLDANMKSLSEEQLRTDAADLDEQNTDRRIRSIQELDRRQKLNIHDEKFGDQNVQFSQQLGKDLAGSPERLRQYRDNMMRNNPDMALRVLFNDLKSDGDVKGLNDAIQQKQISTTVLSKGLYENLLKQDALKDEAGNILPEGDERRTRGTRKIAAIMNHLKDISPDEETLRGHWRNIEPEAARLFGKHLQMRDNESNDQRAMVAKVTGEWGRAFRKEKRPGEEEGELITDTVQKVNEETGEVTEEKVSAAQAYLDELGGSEITKSISDTALEDEEVIKALQKSDNFRFKDWEALRLRRKESREALTKGWGKIVEAAPKDDDGAVSFDWRKYGADEETAKKDMAKTEFASQQYFLATKGKDNPYNLGDDEGLERFQRTVRGASATDISGLEKSADYKANPEYAKLIREQVGTYADPGELKDLLLMSPQFAQEIIQDTEKKLKEDLGSDDAEVRGKAENRLRKLANQIGVNSYMSYSPYDEEWQDLKKKKGKGDGGGGSEGGTPPPSGGGPTPTGPAPRPRKPGPMKTPKAPRPSTPAPTPAPTPEPEPPVTEPEEPEEESGPEELRDTLIDQRGIERFERTKAKIEEYEEFGGADAFYASSEFKKNREQYLTAAQLRKLEVHPLGGVSAFGRRENASNTLGFDSRVAGFEAFQHAGEYITDPLRKQAFATQYIKQIDEQLAKLQEKPEAERSRGEQTYIDRLVRAKERLSDPDELANLQVVNNARLGYSDRHVVAHERTHAKLAELDPQKTFRKQLMSGMAPEALQDVLASVRRKMNDAELTDAEAFDEYLTEGLVNAKKSWADTSEDAINLDPAILEQVQKRVYDGAIAKGQTPEQAEKAKFAVSIPTAGGSVTTAPRSRENLMFRADRINREREAAVFRQVEAARQAKEAADKAEAEAAEEATATAEEEAEERAEGKKRAVKGLRVGQRGQAGIGRRILDAFRPGEESPEAAQRRSEADMRRLEKQMEKAAADREKLEQMKVGVTEKRAYRDNAVARVADAKKILAEKEAEIERVHQQAEAAADVGDVVATGKFMDQEEALTDALRPYQRNLKTEEERAEVAERDLQRAVDAGDKQRRNVQQGKEKLGIKKPPKSPPPTPPTTPVAPTPPTPPPAPAPTRSAPPAPTAKTRPAEPSSAPAPKASTATAPTSKPPSPTSSFTSTSGARGGDREESHADIQNALEKLGQARVEDMAALRDVFETGVKSLERAGHQNADTIRKQFSALPHLDGGVTDHNEMKRVFKEFGEELVRSLRKTPPSGGSKSSTTPMPGKPTPPKPPTT